MPPRYPTKSCRRRVVLVGVTLATDLPLVLVTSDATMAARTGVQLLTPTVADTGACGPVVQHSARCTGRTLQPAVARALAIRTAAALSPTMQTSEEGAQIVPIGSMAVEVDSGMLGRVAHPPAPSVGVIRSNTALIASVCGS